MNSSPPAPSPTIQAPSLPVSRKLHLGVGKCYLPKEEGWTNIDVFSSVPADEYMDVRALDFDRQTFDLIFASHITEHIQRHQVLATLGHWKSLLKPGGTLRLAVPNFEAISAHYQQFHRLPELMGLLYGGQNHPLNRHCMAFDQYSLTDLLTKVGFVNVRFWDWRKTEHSSFDDYSQCYLPHMQKDNGGRLMSLNMEADRPE
jgi:predicted SAM-dependent methyltransferase